MACSNAGGLEPGAAKWYGQMNPLGYDGTPPQLLYVVDSTPTNRLTKWKPNPSHRLTFERKWKQPLNLNISCRSFYLLGWKESH